MATIDSVKVGASSNDPARLYAYEIPPLAPGEYEIVTHQTIKAEKEVQEIKSTQPVHVKATYPYSIPENLVHSYYPPSNRLVSATTLPHVVLKGATAWERSEECIGTPTPWVALLLFTENELLMPTELATPGIRPSGTRSLKLPFTAVNGNFAKYCQNGPFLPSADSSVDGTSGSAEFIFVNSQSFRMFFEQQDESKGEQKQVDLDRYKYLSVMADSGVDDGTGHNTAKLSTLIGHRMRPYTLGDSEQRVHAHLVSIEKLGEKINWNAAKADTATIALISLFSWSFSWEACNKDSGLELFEHLGRKESTRALTIDLPALTAESKLSSDEEEADFSEDEEVIDPAAKQEAYDKANSWVRERISEGYTIVRHRDIAGEASMALYRGPLTPRPTRRPKLKPSSHGTDLQIVDVAAQILDVSYSVAWELGRTLAGKDARFSAAMADLRRELCLHAITETKTTEHKDKEDLAAREVKLVHKAKDVVSSVLDRLDELFAKPLTDKISGLPLNTAEEEKAARWQVPHPSTSSTAKSGGMMTNAKMCRYLKAFTRGWLEVETRKLVNSQDSKIPSLSIVFKWLVDNFLSLKLVSSTYLFPDPAAIKNESTNCFLIDDVWVDALLDGAMSLANTMGGGDDPVREEIKMAFNIYLAEAPASLVPVCASGFVLKSGVVESFPDLQITILTKGEVPKPIQCPYKVRHDNMIFCLVPRGDDRKVVDYDIEFKLPPHQQKFSLDQITKDGMKFDFELAPFLRQTHAGAKSDKELKALQKAVTWNKPGPMGAGNTYPPIWSWTTGILTPYRIADMMDRFIKEASAKYPEYPLDIVDKNSRSLYLATQLMDRDHSVRVPIKIARQLGDGIRKMFPKHVPEKDTRDNAVTHDMTSTSPGGDSGKSFFKKQAFSQAFPGETIPAESNKPQHLVFSIKATDQKDHVPADTELISMEVIIPLGEESTDLLDPLQPLPTARVVAPTQQFIVAVTHRADEQNKKVAKELVVHLKPRGGGGATLKAGLDASFMLLKATVNGVFGEDVPVKTREVYVQRVMQKKGDKEVEVQNRSVVEDVWYLVKE